MKKIIILLFVFPFILKSQETVELLLPWNIATDSEQDTSTIGMMALQDAENNYLILMNIQKFSEGGSGVPIGGYPTIGSGIIKLSEVGQNLWQSLYQTDTFLTSGTVSADQFILNADNQIVLPFSSYVDILFCDSINSNSAAFSDKKGLMSIDQETGIIINEERFFEDNLCERDKVEAIRATDFGYVLLYHDYVFTDPFYIEKLNFDFEVIEVDTFQSPLRWVQFSEYEDYFISASQYSLTAIDYEANIEEIINIEVEDTITAVATIKWAENEQYYIIGMNGYYFGDRISTLYLLDKQGSTVGNLYYDTKVIKDVEITDENEILVLFELINNADTIFAALEVTQFDLELNEIGSKIYGFPFVQPTDINLTRDQLGFFVTGTRFKSFDLDYGKERDQAYFLKDNIDNLLLDQNDILKSSGIKMFPNPTNSSIKIEIENHDHFKELEIINAEGRLMTRYLLPKINQVFINLPEGAGVYFIRIKTRKDSYIRKVVKM